MTGTKLNDLPCRRVGASFDDSFGKVEQIYGVQGTPADVSLFEESTMLISKKWIDALALSQLIRLFQVECPTNPAPGSTSNAGQS